MIRRSLALVLGAFLAIGACSSEESSAPHGHTPEAVKLFDGATELSVPIQLAASQTLQVEVKLYNDEGEEIALDADHLVGITATPTGLVTVSQVTATTFELTAQATAGSGSVTVGWGHDAPDELTFGPFAVDVVP